MQATNRKDMRTNEFLRQTMKRICQVWNVPRATFLLSTFLGLALLFGCAPSSSQKDGAQSSSDSASNSVPELSDEVINERINDASVWEVPEESGAAEPIGWSFDEDEPKEITVVEKQLNGDSATVVLDIKTRSATHVRNPRQLAGQIRTEWELKTGWVLRKWIIVRTDNISMKYKNIPKPPAQNSNR